jgi:hypothetical protein
MLGLQLIGGTVTEAVKQKFSGKAAILSKEKPALARYAVNEANAERLT